MKTSSWTAMWVLLIFALSAASAAWAVPDPATPRTPPPAAPEPGLLLMVACGLALGGGYLVWRNKQSKSKSAT